MKRLADTLELHARARERQGKDPHLNRIHALKFYAISHSSASAVRVARDLVDEFLDRGDAIGAKHVVESMLLPLFTEGEALEYFLPIHSQYAVVLAYCGEFDNARRTMRELTPFLDASPQWRGELENQKKLIELIAQGRVTLPEPMKNQIGYKPSERKKIGRNEPCVCGSGKKYKKCCGK